MAPLPYYWFLEHSSESQEASTWQFPLIVLFFFPSYSYEDQPIPKPSTWPAISAPAALKAVCLFPTLGSIESSSTAVWLHIPLHLLVIASRWHLIFVTWPNILCSYFLKLFFDKKKYLPEVKSYGWSLKINITPIDRHRSWVLSRSTKLSWWCKWQMLSKTPADYEHSISMLCMYCSCNLFKGIIAFCRFLQSHAVMCGACSVMRCLILTQALERTAQGGGGVSVLGGIQEVCGWETWVSDGTQADNWTWWSWKSFPTQMIL